MYSKTIFIISSLLCIMNCASTPNPEKKEKNIEKETMKAGEIEGTTIYYDTPRAINEIKVEPIETKENNKQSKTK